jgi:ABC-type glycerol-3-phosphate transport system substrate-binding protein
MCTVQGIVYNKAVFEEAGITELPKTPDEFLTCLQMIKDNTDAIPYYTNANSGWTLDQWEDHTFGTITGNANYKNNELPNDTAAFEEGSSHYVVAKLLYDIVSQGLCEADPTTCDWEASKLMLNNGEIGCMVLGSWAVSQMKGAGENADDVGYMPFPYSVDGKQYATSGTDYCYAINKNTKNMAAARAFVEFMVEESGLALAQGGISLMKNDPMPDGLENFADVEFVVDMAATDENAGKLDTVQQDSGVTLYDNGQRLNGVVDIARGVSSQTFEEYMADLNAKWAGAIQ